MTKPTDRWTDRLSEYLDGELPAREKATLERHLEGCRACARTLEELRTVVARARELEATVPPRDLWPGIAAQIAEQRKVRPIAEARRRRERRRAGGLVTLSLPQAAAAAIALMALSGGLVWTIASGGADGSGPGAASGPGGSPDAAFVAAGDGSGPAASTLARYRAAIAELERAVFEQSGTLDTATVRRIRQSLATIDRAIEEARQALREDPADPYLNHHLAETMRRKVDMLQRTAVLTLARS